MSQDLLTQLAEYGGYCEKRQGSVEADEVIGRVVPLAAPVRPTRPRRGWLGAVAAAVAVLALGLLTFLTRETAPEAPVLSRPSPSPTVAAPVPLLSAPIEEAASGWSRVPYDEAVFGGAAMNSVIAGGPGLVAVGEDNLGAAVWTSVDGLTWSRVPHDEAVFGGASDLTMNSVTVGGPGFVAVGWDRSGDDPSAAVWTSPDGITWSRVSHDETVFGGTYSQLMTSVTVGGPGLVAVGFDGGHDHIDGGGIEDQDAAVWTSVDGITWSRVPDDETVFGGADNQVMISVTVGGPGLVAVGWDGEEDWFSARGDAAVWISVDGITWSRVPHDESVFGGLGNPAMRDVTAGGSGLVAVGYDESNLPVWTSVDGITWSRVPADESVFGGVGFEVMMSVTAGGPGLVAVGELDGADAIAWTSVDGITWSRVPADESVFGGDAAAFSVTVGGPGLVAVGNVTQGAAVWVTREGWEN